MEQSDEPLRPQFLAWEYGGSELHGPNRLSYWLGHKQLPLLVIAALIADVDPDSLQFSADQSSLLAARMLRDSRALDDDMDHDVDDECERRESPDALGARLKRHFNDIRDFERLLGGFNPRREYATPAEWITIALEHKIHIPWLAWAEWEKLVKLTPTSETKKQKPLVEKERQSMLKIIAALCAIGKVDIRHASSGAVTIAEQCERMDLGISEGTVTKYLKDAKELLKPEK